MIVVRSALIRLTSTPALPEPPPRRVSVAIFLLNCNVSVISARTFFVVARSPPIMAMQSIRLAILTFAFVFSFSLAFALAFSFAAFVLALTTSVHAWHLTLEHGLGADLLERQLLC